MPISFADLTIGHAYDRPFLAKAWGYRSHAALGRGIVTPSGQSLIILFITKEKQASLEQYEDDFDGEYLHMDGETSRTNDTRLENSLGREHVHLFYRARHHQPFTYHGEIYLVAASITAGGKPSRFTFCNSMSLATATSAIVTEETAHGDVEAEFVPDEEGRRILRQHVTYERSRKNRARALEIHGTICIACGFDFNAVYGLELAQDFIEVHHTKSITKTDGVVDPENDLVPLCSNCHSMVHRRVGRIFSIEELKNRLASNKSAETVLNSSPRVERP
jgi:5-methylcytosine-specific restriction enzyme A